MYISKHREDITRFLENKGGRVAFIPTMGALHDGHVSLVRMAREKVDIVVCSIFVNPTQFDNPEDLENYPRPIADDMAILASEDCDVLYLPSVEDIYPEGQENLQVFDLGYLDEILEGEYRDGHYQGVANVVDRLLNIVDPDFLILGAKDYQQVMVISKMKTDLGHEVEILVAPTMRTRSGLAQSSRNRRLSDKEKHNASAIYRELYRMQNIENRQVPFAEVQRNMVEKLRKAGFGPIDYVALADADTLEILADFDESRKMIILVAAYMGDIRLIDNMLLNPSNPSH